MGESNERVRPMTDFLTHCIYLIIGLFALYLVYMLFMLGCGLVNLYAPTHKAVRSYVDEDDDNIYRDES